MSTTESVLLDTSIIIAHFCREPALAERLKSATLYIRLTVLGELYCGAFKSEYQGHIKADLERAGSRIPENDLWIAALAREHQLPLVTRDQHFSLVKGLKALAW